MVKSIEGYWAFEKIIFPDLYPIKENIGYAKEQMLLVIMDMVKGQDKNELTELCGKNNCELMIIPHNLTNKFQPLDRNVNKVAKAHVSEKYNNWMTIQILK